MNTSRLNLPLKKSSKYIEIVASNKSRLNAMNKTSREAVMEALSERFDKVRITIIKDELDLVRLVEKKPDLVVLGMKLILLNPTLGYDKSPKIWLSDYLTENNINFTGSESSALTLEYDKQDAKQKVIDKGLNSSAYFISTFDMPNFKHNLEFPLFVKPTNRGNSKGIDENSIVYNQLDLRNKIMKIHNEYDSDVLIEEYLPGREFSVAVIKQVNSNKLLAMPIEITAPKDENGNRFLSETVKKADSEEVNAVSSVKLKLSLNKLAIDVFRALGSRDYGRIDMRLDALGIPSFIEANLMPGLSRQGYLSRCFYINEKIKYNDMILQIINEGFSRTVNVFPEEVLETIN